jgi:hypothetical protein
MKRRVQRHDRGVAATEFVIVVIPFMMLLMAVIQLSLASFAKVLVSHAAYAAARAAIVVVPATDSGSANQVSDDKRSQIQKAAAFAMVAASPASTVLSIHGDTVGQALDAGSFGATPLGRSLLKLVYAEHATAVRLTDASGNQKDNFAWNEPITAHVTYLYRCLVPLANRYICKPFTSIDSEKTKDLSSGPWPGYYLAFSADHTLVNQGVPQ